jgi:tetratricopeptide (TPR) repeat protein
VHERQAAPGARGGVVKPALTAAFALLPFVFGFSLLESKNADVEKGNAAMKVGKAEEALGHYDKAIAKLPQDAGAHYDRGAALYALSRFEEAGQEFLRATQAADANLKADAFFNLGNAFGKQDKWKEAIEAYKRTLGLRPGDQAAKWNLEVALAKKKEEEKKQQDKDKDDKDDNKKDDEKKDQDQKDDKKDDKKKDDQKKDDKKDDKKDQSKDDQKDKKDDKDGNQPPPPKPAGQEPQQQQIEAVLDNLERSSKDLEKERARLRAVRRRPPAKDW